MEKKTKTFYEEAGSPMDRMEQLFEKRIEDGMFREVENYFADGYTVQKNGKAVKINEKPLEYSILTGTLRHDIEEVAHSLDIKFGHIPLITEVPMYRKALIAELELLRDFTDETVRQLKEYDKANPTDSYPYLPAPPDEEDAEFDTQ